MKNENENTKELLFSVTADDCKWDYFKGQGSGGQKKNKTENCCRCTHIPSKAVGVGQNGRSKFQNRKTAFVQMTKTKEFKNWHRIETARHLGILTEIEQIVNKQMHPRNLKIEVKQNDRWVNEKI